MIAFLAAGDAMTGHRGCPGTGIKKDIRRQEKKREEMREQRRGEEDEEEVKTTLEAKRQEKK